jgi:hypothetical protein
MIERVAFYTRLLIFRQKGCVYIPKYKVLYSVYQILRRCLMASTTTTGSPHGAISRWQTPAGPLILPIPTEKTPFTDWYIAQTSRT